MSMSRYKVVKIKAQLSVEYLAILLIVMVSATLVLHYYFHIQPTIELIAKARITANDCLTDANLLLTASDFYVRDNTLHLSLNPDHNLPSNCTTTLCSIIPQYLGNPSFLQVGDQNTRCS